MTDQERSAAREAVIDYRAGFGLSLAETGGPEKEAIEAMHAVLAKHEADVRKRLADEIAFWENEQGARHSDYLAVVNPPEPPKPVLCKICGAPIWFAAAANEWLHTDGGHRMCGYAQPVASEGGAS